jgi:hypothetical protein
MSTSLTTSSSRNPLRDAPGEKPDGSRVATTTRAALEASGFSPGVSRRELCELVGSFLELELLFL